MKKTRIIIAGGGFAGLYAARHFDKRLARRPDVEVVLISRENFLLFTPMLHEVATGELHPGDIVTPLRRTLRHVKVVEAEVRAAASVACVAWRISSLSSSLITCFSRSVPKPISSIWRAFATGR